MSQSRFVGFKVTPNLAPEHEPRFAGFKLASNLAPEHEPRFAGFKLVSKSDVFPAHFFRCGHTHTEKAKLSFIESGVDTVCPNCDAEHAEFDAFYYHHIKNGVSATDLFKAIFTGFGCPGGQDAPRIISDETLCLGIEQDPSVIEYIPKRFHSDCVLRACVEAAKPHPELLESLSERVDWFNVSDAFMTDMIVYYPECIRCIPRELYTTFMLSHVISAWPHAIEHFACADPDRFDWDLVTDASLAVAVRASKGAWNAIPNGRKTPEIGLIALSLYESKDLSCIWDFVGIGEVETFISDEDRGHLIFNHIGSECPFLEELTHYFHRPAWPFVELTKAACQQILEAAPVHIKQECINSLEWIHQNMKELAFPDNK